MCLAVFALDQHPRFAFVLAANRDEFFDRPAAPLDWWAPHSDAAPVLAGRDLSAGGTWFGLSMAGRLALLTNVRDPARHRPEAPSRGRIVTDWLTGRACLDEARRHWQTQGFNGFNVIAADLTAGQWGWADAQGAAALALPAGLHGLSNASLDTPWPKVLRLRARMAQALAATADLAGLVSTLFDALADDQRAADAALPATGLPLPLERALSSVFISTDDGRYGTRCSTVLVREHEGRTHVFERSHAPDGGMLSWVTLPAWPGAPGGLQGQVPVQRLDQRGQGRRTTLPSTFKNASAF